MGNLTKNDSTSIDSNRFQSIQIKAMTNNSYWVERDKINGVQDNQYSVVKDKYDQTFRWTIKAIKCLLCWWIHIVHILVQGLVQGLVLSARL